MNRLETQLQIKCVRWCKDHIDDTKVLWTSVPANEISVFQGMKNKSLGLKRGWPDLTFIWEEPGFNRATILFIEFKTEKGRQTPEQVDFEKTAGEIVGCLYFVVRSFDHFVDIMHEYDAPLAEREPLGDVF